MKELTPYKFYRSEYKLTIEYTKYYNGKLAVILHDGDDEFGVATVNLPASDDLDDKTQFVDTNNLPGIDKWLEENDIAEYTGIDGYSGFCAYPLMQFK